MYSIRFFLNIFLVLLTFIGKTKSFKEKVEHFRVSFFEAAPKNLKDQEENNNNNNQSGLSAGIPLQERRDSGPNIVISSPQSQENITDDTGDHNNSNNDDKRNHVESTKEKLQNEEEIPNNKTSNLNSNDKNNDETPIITSNHHEQTESVKSHENYDFKESEISSGENYVKKKENEEDINKLSRDEILSLDAFNGKKLKYLIYEQVIKEIMKFAKEGLNGILKLKDSKISNELFAEALNRLKIDEKELDNIKNTLSLEMYDNILSMIFKIMTEESYYKFSYFFESMGINKENMDLSLKELKIKILKKNRSTLQ